MAEVAISVYEKLIDAEIPTKIMGIEYSAHSGKKDELIRRGDDELVRQSVEEITDSAPYSGVEVNFTNHKEIKDRLLVPGSISEFRLEIGKRSVSRISVDLEERKCWVFNDGKRGNGHVSNRYDSKFRKIMRESGIEIQ
jgi:hypothetical protein